VNFSPAERKQILLLTVIVFALSAGGTSLAAQDDPAVAKTRVTGPPAVERVDGNGIDECANENRCEPKPVLELKKQAVQKADGQQKLSAAELASQINNPAAPVTFVQFRNIMAPNIPGTGGVTNSY
jgi:hypothetical protein